MFLPPLAKTPSSGIHLSSCVDGGLAFHVFLLGWIFIKDISKIFALLVKVLKVWSLLHRSSHILHICQPVPSIFFQSTTSFCVLSLVRLLFLSSLLLCVLLLLSEWCKCACVYVCVSGLVVSEPAIWCHVGLVLPPGSELLIVAGYITHLILAWLYLNLLFGVMLPLYCLQVLSCWLLQATSHTSFWLGCIWTCYLVSCWPCIASRFWVVDCCRLHHTSFWLIG